MLIKQLSVFLENRAGRSLAVTQALANNGINIMAFSMADRDEFGVLRLIVSDVDAAVAAMRDAGFASVVTDVVSVSCPNTTGSLAQLMSVLASENISVEYMYAFQDGDKTNAVIRPASLQACVDALSKHGL